MTACYWADMTTEEFRAVDTDRAIAVLPAGATEQHGPHLPLSVDSDLVLAVLEASFPAIDPGLDVLVLPMQPIGRSIEHEDFPGTLSLSTETLVRLWTDIGRGVAGAGIRKLVIFNGHGGNVSTMDIVARDLRVAHNMLTAHTSWYALAEAGGVLDAQELIHGIHGGALETSAMLAIHEDAVRKEKLAAFPSAGEGWSQRNRFVGVGGKPVKLGWMMRDLNPDGAAGNAAAADAEIGRKLIDRAASNFAAFLSEFDAMAPPEDNP